MFLRLHLHRCPRLPWFVRKKRARVVSEKLEKVKGLVGAAVSSFGHLGRVIELRRGTEEASVVAQRVLLLVRNLVYKINTGTSSYALHSETLSR
jgi:hypothetical protein